MKPLGQHRGLAAAKAQDDDWEPEDSALLSGEDARRRRLLAGLIESWMIPLLRAREGEPQAAYAVSFGRSRYPRLARMNRTRLALNVAGLEVQGWLDWLGRAGEGKTSAAEDRRMLFDIIENVVHEDAHAWEGTGHETHDEAFVERMRASLLELLALGFVPERALDGLRPAAAKP